MPVDCLGSGVTAWGGFRNPSPLCRTQRVLGVVGGAGAHEPRGDPPLARNRDNFALSPPQAGSGPAVRGWDPACWRALCEPAEAPHSLSRSCAVPGLRPQDS